MSAIRIVSQGDQTLPPVVWLASYPRSGNTLLRTILWHCFGLRSASIYQDDLGQSKALADYVGHIESGPDNQIVLPLNSIPAIKTHGPPVDDNPAIYVVRHGAAASVSMWRFFDQSYSLEQIIAGQTPFGIWSSHLETWKPWQRPHTLILKYESMADDVANVVDSISRFLQRDILRKSIPDRDAISGAGGKWVNKKRDWRFDISDELLTMFIELNAPMLAKMGYA